MISDVHGNLHALRAAVTDLRRLGVDRWLSVGDLIGYGPRPNECVETVAELDALGVAGNHELIALGTLPGAASSERAQRSHRRTAAVLHEDVVTYLAALPQRLDIDGIVVTHGSLDDPEAYVSRPAQAAEQLSQLAREHPSARFLLVGNTHRQLLCAELDGCRPISCRSPMPLDATQRHLANPGSVGQSRQWEWPPPARAMVLDLEASTAIFRRIPYDVRAARRELARQGLPYTSIQSPPPLRAAVRRRVQKLLPSRLR